MIQISAESTSPVKYKFHTARYEYMRTSVYYTKKLSNQEVFYLTLVWHAGSFVPTYKVQVQVLRYWPRERILTTIRVFAGEKYGILAMESVPKHFP